jgi:hypothetical protein
VSASSDQPTVCATRGCRELLPARSGRGRPRLYCSPRCRRLSVARSSALSVEVDHDSDEGNGRPTGRVWLRMCRGSDQVVIATELGRPSADHLAGQIAQLIEGRQRAQGGAGAWLVAAATMTREVAHEMSSRLLSR